MIVTAFRRQVCYLVYFSFSVILLSTPAAFEGLSHDLAGANTPTNRIAHSIVITFAYAVTDTTCVGASRLTLGMAPVALNPMQFDPTAIT
jgi:hypothetical protein